MRRKLHIYIFIVYLISFQSYPDIANRTAALIIMPKGRYQYLKKLLPLLTNQSEDCLTLNIYVPGSGEFYINIFYNFNYT